MIDSSVVKRIHFNKTLFALWCNNLSDSKLIDVIYKRANWKWIKYVDNPSDSVCMAAVRRTGNSIKHISNPSEAVCMAAVENNGNAIGWISDPSSEVLLAAKESLIKYGWYDFYIMYQCKHWELLEAL